MEGLTLLQQAHEAGLSVAAEAGELVIRGPRTAEPVALLLLDRKPEVLAALAEAADWRARHIRALDHWAVSHPADEAACLAWGELVNRWHRLHGVCVPRWQCAGCGEPISAAVALDLADGCRVHLADLDCLLDYGARWRRAAIRGLVALGLQPPAATEDQS
jgi:hypothetical protein